MQVIEIHSLEILERAIEKAVERFFNQRDVQAKENNPLLTRYQAAQYLSISLGTLHAHTKSGKIQAQRIGCRLLYRKSDLDKSFTSTIKQ